MKRLSEFVKVNLVLAMFGHELAPVERKNIDDETR